MVVSNAIEVLFGIPPLIVSAWLLARWLRSHSSPERWLAMAAATPLAIVLAHWWWYPSDSVVGHLWVAAFQVLAFLGVIQTSRAFAGVSRRSSRHDDNVGLVSAGAAAFSATMFLLLFGEDGGTLDILAPAFMARPPEWWSSVGHSWTDWFLLTIGLLTSSIVIRRGWRVGYVCLALAVSLVALFHWAHYYVAYPFAGGRGAVLTLMVASGLCWLLAAHRLLVRRRIA